MLLSILICTLEERWDKFQPLKEHLVQQILKQPEGTVEMKIFCDKKENTTGAKRDFLLRGCEGEYSVHVDCDDWVPDYYVEEILKALETKPDCVPIDGIYTRDGLGPVRWRMSKDFPNTTIWEDGEQVFIRSVNHIGVVKNTIATQIGFPDISNGEDKYYSEGIRPLLQTEVKIPKHMYDYRYSSYNKLYK
jgi:hypothetical protein